jgi:Flp pilus assembly protein TadB
MTLLSALLAALATVLLAVPVWRRPRRVRDLAPQAGRARSGSRVARHQVARALAIAAIAAAAGPLVAAAAVVAILALPVLRTIRDRRRAVAAITEAFPDFVDLLVLGVKAGHSPRRALEASHEVTPDSIRPAVDAALHRVTTGQRFAEAITVLAEPHPRGLGPIARPLIDSLALADRYGTPLPPILEQLAGDARAQRRRNADAAARRLPIQLSFPLVGCTLPSFVLLTIVPLLAGTVSSLRGLAP